MNLNVNDKVVVKEPVNLFGKTYADIGDVFSVKEVNPSEKLVTLTSGVVDMLIDNNYFENHFEKHVEEKGDVAMNKITCDMIDDIVDRSEIITETLFDKCTLVSCKLPNGFVITETSSCVDPDNYDEEKGYNICMGNIRDKIWELEGYLLQDKLSKLDSQVDIEEESEKEEGKEDMEWLDRLIDDYYDDSDEESCKYYDGKCDLCPYINSCYDDDFDEW